MCVCVRAKHLQRCKTSNRHYEFYFQQGATAPLISPWPTKLLMFGEDMQSDQLHVPALYHFIVNGNRLSPEPACRTIFISFHFCTVVALWNYLRSIKEDWAASERFDSSSKDFERFTSHCFSLLVIQCLLSGLNEVFLHVRCVPHQNSQRCFWASVWFMLDSSRWHEPFGECLSKQRIDTLNRPLNWHFWN